MTGTQHQPPPAPGRAADLVHDLYQAHAVTLTRLARLLVRDQPSAEDVVQDAFLSLYRRLPRLAEPTGPDEILPYLRKAVLNGARSVLRKRRRAALLSVLDQPPEPSAEAAALAGEGNQAVLAALDRLPRRAREVLVLRYYLDLSDREIAAALGVSRSTVSSTASRAVAAIARDLGEEP
jgi:RNA polymerase sigma-70 factor (sigma-E family)